VVNDDGPVGGASVRPAGPAFTPRVTTDAKGYYKVTGVVPGQYFIQASKPGVGWAKARSVTVLAGTRIDRLDFRLAREAVISGRVLEKDKTPLQGADVLVVMKTLRSGRFELRERAFTKTDDRGGYRISGLSEGAYYIQVLPQQLRVRASARSAPAVRQGGSWNGIPMTVFYPGALSFSGAEPVRLHAGERREGVDITFERTPTYCITVTIAVPSALTIYYPFSDAPARPVASGAVLAGQPSEVCGLPSGSYRGVATIFDRESKMMTGFVKTDFTIGRKDVELGVLQPAPATPVRGKITVQDARAEDALPEGIELYLGRHGRPLYNGEATGVSVKGSGEFELPNAFPDEYALALKGLPQGYYLREAAQDGRDIRRGPIRGGGGELRIVLASDGATIGGSVVDKEQRPLPDMPVFLLPKTGDEVFSGQSDLSGRFRFSTGVAPGEYRIFALSGVLDGEELDDDFLRLNAAGAVEVVVAARSSRMVVVEVRAVR